MKPRRIAGSSLWIACALLLLPATALVSAQKSKTKQTPPPPVLAYQEVEAYDVYDAVLPLSWSWQVENASSLAIQVLTSPYPTSRYRGMCLQPDANSERIVGDSIRDYVKKNQTQWSLMPYYLRLTKPYSLVGPDEVLALSQSNGWTKFAAAHPKSGQLIVLSAVGFNAEKDVAVLYMGHLCGGECGGGEFYVMQKKDGKWLPLPWSGTDCRWAS